MGVASEKKKVAREVIHIMPTNYILMGMGVAFITTKEKIA